MSLTGNVSFANNISNIFSGDDVKIVVELENQEKVFLKEIFINFRGMVNVKWEDLINKNEDGKIIFIMQRFEDHQTLLDKHITLLTMITLNKGKHCYNVILNIPEHLPESVKRKFGSISYELELCVYYTQGMLEVLHKMPIDVKQYLNVCLLREYWRPFHTILKKSFCWGICNSEPLKLVLTLPTTTFIAGDYINYFVKIDNFSKLLDVKRLSVILMQTQYCKVFKPKTRTKQFHDTLNQKTHFFNVHHHNSKLKGSFSLPHSLVSSSSSKTCYLSTSYNLHFIIVFTRFHTDGYISIPITIGSHKDSMGKISPFPEYETTLKIEHEKRIEIQV